MRLQAAQHQHRRPLLVMRRQRTFGGRAPGSAASRRLCGQTSSPCKGCVGALCGCLCPCPRGRQGSGCPGHSGTLLDRHGRVGDHHGQGGFQRTCSSLPERTAQQLRLGSMAQPTGLQVRPAPADAHGDLGRAVLAPLPLPGHGFPVTSSCCDSSTVGKSFSFACVREGWGTCFCSEVTTHRTGWEDVAEVAWGSRDPAA